MPSSPKKTPKTGSALLGQELKRLRGGRTLKEIVALSKSPSLSQLVAPLSEAGLCEIESGKSMPLLATLHTLSVVYKTSMNQLMAFVKEEKAAAEVAAPANLEEGARLFSELLSREEWTQALQVALSCEGICTSDSLATSWRANRASCLSRMGLHAEAVELFTECCESPALDPAQRAVLLHNLACAHLSSGNIWAASSVTRDAVELATRADCSASQIAALEMLRARLLIETRQAGLSSDDVAIRDAIRLIASARQRTAPSDRIATLRMDLEVAQAHSCLGNNLVAARDCERLLAEAQALGADYIIGKVHYVRADVLEKQGQLDKAADGFARCLEVAERVGDHDLAFDAAFRVFGLTMVSRPGHATMMLKRCEQLLPRLTGRTQSVRRFEKVARSRS